MTKEIELIEAGYEIAQIKEGKFIGTEVGFCIYDPLDDEEGFYFEMVDRDQLIVEAHELIFTD